MELKFENYMSTNKRDDEWNNNINQAPIVRTHITRLNGNFLEPTLKSSSILSVGFSAFNL